MTRQELRLELDKARRRHVAATPDARIPGTRKDAGVQRKPSKREQQLREELARVRAERTRLKQRCDALRRGRDLWRHRALRKAA